MHPQTQLSIDPAYPSHQTVSAAPADSTKSPMLVFGILRRRKWSILLTLIVLSALVVAGASRLKQSFVATASVLMQQQNAGAMDISLGAGMIATDSLAVRTQVDILKSADLARAVVRSMRLIDQPEFSAHSGGSAKMLRLLGVRRPPAPALPLPMREELATQILLGMTTIVNDGHSYVIDIKVKVSADNAAGAGRAAELSAQIANAYADVYAQFTSKMKSDSIRQANSFFDDRIAVLRQKMQDAESAVQTYRAANDLIEDSGASGEGRSVTIVGQQMAQLNADLIAATSDRAKAEASLDQITATRSGGGDLQSAPEVVGSPLIQGLREQQAELGGREAALAMSRGEGSADLMAVRASQRNVAQQIAADTVKIAASLRSSVAAARARESALRSTLAQLQGRVGAQGQTEIKLHELQNEADVARLIYSTYLKRLEETASQLDMQAPDAVVVSRAGVPLGASPPSKQQIVMAGEILVAMLAAFQALVRERMQSGFRTAAELEASVGIETLGLIPKVRNPRDALRFDDRHSAFSEAINSIRALLRLKSTRPSQIIMVTSALPQEGKTFFSSSLARNAAIAGERVVLIDCDLRRPAVARNMVTSPQQTLDNVIIRRDELSSLDVITLTAELGSPQDLFASPRMRSLLSLLRERYDMIVLDTPPVLAVSDARILSPLCDVAVVVVRWQRTAQHLVNGAIAALRGSGANVAGTVITQVNLRNMDAADGAYAYFYYKHASRTPEAVGVAALPSG